MSITELVESAQFLVDAGGNRKAVLLELTVWEELLNLLDELEDLTDTSAAIEAYKNMNVTRRAPGRGPRWRPRW